MINRLTYKRVRPFVHGAFWLLLTLKLLPVVERSGPVWGWYYVLYGLMLVASTYFNFYYLVPRYFLQYRYRRYFSLLALEWIGVVGILFALVWAFNHVPKPNAGPASMYTIAFVNYTAEFLLVSVVKLAKELYLKSQRGRQHQKEKMQAELQLLRGQLSPHFLFNTLNNIYSLITTRKSDQAGESVLLLSDMLHYMLYETSTGKVPLKDELAFIRSYTDLERLRLDQTQPLQYSVSGSSEGFIAPLILFNFIENAFKHAAGTARCSGSAPLFIDIRIHAADDRLHMAVANSRRPDGESGPAGHGIGMENARKRLDLIYGDSYRLDISKTPDTFNLQLDIPLL